MSCTHQAISILDIIRIMSCKKPEESSSRCGADGIVPAEVERDLKLMTSILGIEHSALIMLGAITGYGMLHVPWILMQLCIIAIELVVFVVRLFLEGLHVSRDEIFIALLSLHNWFQVYCLFQRQFYQS
ncbi:uncharacterized protein LOC106646557 [Copidosoma floridanum]|uniref:uncharacterized protein LOC106646557 n=1 Tax=Copidosoma floridanum TaxID=29053 RepID=UPI000C6F4A45|nr:uncharacterized protein LOC106646557 [Copidosoma floridanum]